VLDRALSTKSTAECFDECRSAEVHYYAIRVTSKEIGAHVERLVPSPSADSTFLSSPVLLGGAGTSTRLGSVLTDCIEGRALRVLLAVNDAVREVGADDEIRSGPATTARPRRWNHEAGDRRPVRLG